MQPLRASLIALAVASLGACDLGTIDAAPHAIAAGTPAEALRARLATLAASGRVVFGMQRFNLTGVDASGAQWLGSEGDLDRSDVRTLVGAHPGMLGVDVWDLAIKPASWTPTPAAHAAAMKQVSAAGGLVTMDWHMRGCHQDSFATAGNEDCLCKLANDDAYARAWLVDGNLARYADALARFDLRRVPILFRPLHEMTGAWFWWGFTSWDCARLVPGAKVTGGEAYRKVYRTIVDYLRRERGLDNLLFAYAPDKLWDGLGSTEEERYLAGYPGDAYVDVLGIDLYFLDGIDANQLQTTYTRYLQLVTRLAQQHGKVAALTEVGDYRLAAETTPTQARWFQDHLLPLVTAPGVELAYALTWENRTRRATEFYVPYVGHPGVDDFKAFAADPRVLFLDDLGGATPPPVTPPVTAPNGLPYCTANGGRGYGELYACGAFTCAKTDTTYQVMCVVR
jgi:mannan endo-1,4-beta-mannosidase